MEELNLNDLFHYYVKRIPTIIITVVFAILLGLLYLLFIKQPLYKGETTLILVQDNAPVTQGDITLGRNLVPIYTKIIKSKKVVNEAIERLDLDLTYEEIVSHISVTSEDDTEMIKIIVNNEDAGLAANMANAVATAFKNEIVNIYNLQNVYIFERAEVETSPYNINLVRDLVIFALVGLVGAIGVVFAIYYFDTSIKSSEELEEKLKLNVLGSIPKYKRRKSA